MTVFGKYTRMLLGTVTFLFVLGGDLRAADELAQTGIVKSVDPATKIVIIDVLSSSCRGTRKFIVADAELIGTMVDTTIDFVIDSSTCRHDEIYAIESVFVREVRSHE